MITLQEQHHTFFLLHWWMVATHCVLIL